MAARQHGVVTIAQLLAAGLDRNAIKYRLPRRASPPPSPRGVRRGSPPPVTARHGDGRRARLRSGSRAEPPLRRRAVEDPPALAHADGGDRADQATGGTGIHVHRSPHADATTHYGIRVTTPLRTLVDLADVLNPKQLTRALNEAQVQRLVTPAELTTLLTRYPGRRTAQLTPERGATRSTLEDDFVRFLKRHDLPTPRVQPAHRRPRSRRRLPRTMTRHRTRQPPIPHHHPGLRTGPRPRRRPPQRGVLNPPHHRPPPQIPRNQRGPTPQRDSEPLALQEPSHLAPLDLVGHAQAVALGLALEHVRGR